jgi:uncharacterized membrane protein YhaH (DUF805 family)
MELTQASWQSGDHVGILASIAYSLAVLIPSYAVVVARIHDTVRSGWWILFPVIGFILLPMFTKRCNDVIIGITNPVGGGSLPIFRSAYAQA